MQSLLGKSTGVDDEQVEEWLHEDARNQEYYEKAKYYFDNYYSGEKEIHQINMKKAWDDFLVYTKKSRNNIWKRYLQYVAGVVMLLGVGVALLLLVGKSEKPSTVVQNQMITPGTVKALLIFHSGSQVSLTDSTVFEQVVEQHSMAEKMDEETQMEYNTIIVPRGGEYMLVLTDGTKVWVNADSRLKFPVRFRGDRREVYLLSGEAYFEVERDESKPFLVHTSRGCVKVLGTEFNVRDYPEEHRVVTTRVNGSVQFTGKDKKKIVLEPGFQVVADSLTGTWDVREVNLKEYVGWRNGLYVFSHLTLEELMRVIERNYDVTVFFANEECKRLVFSGDLQKYETVEHFLRFIETGGDVRFVVKERTITVYKK